MNCWRAEPLMAAFVDGDLGRAEAEAMRDHMSSCDACRATYDALCTVPDLEFPTFDADTEQDLWSELDRRINDGLSDDSARPLAPSGRRFLRMLPGLVWNGEIAVPNLAAAAYAAVFIGVLVWGFGQNQSVNRLSADIEARNQAIVELAQSLSDERAASGELDADPGHLPGELKEGRSHSTTPSGDPDFAPNGHTQPVRDQKPIGPVRRF